MSHAPDFAALGSDADANLLSATITAPPQHGTLNQQPDGTWRYTPNANFFGTDTLRFTLNDGRVDSNQATLTITVNPVNDAPTLASRSASIAEDGSLLIDPLVGAADIDGDALTTSIVTDAPPTARGDVPLSGIACAAQLHRRFALSPQCDISTGTVIVASNPRVAPPRMRSVQRAWP